MMLVIKKKVLLQSQHHVRVIRVTMVPTALQKLEECTAEKDCNGGKGTLLTDYNVPGEGCKCKCDDGFGEMIVKQFINNVLLKNIVVVVKNRGI